MKTPKLFKILVIGDLHLGLQSYGLVERLGDHVAVLPQITSYAVEHQPNLAISLGDTFTSPNPDSYSCDMFRGFCQGMTQDGTWPYIALTGNHDREKLDLGMTRVRSLGGAYLDTPGFLTRYKAEGREDCAINVLAFDWMPAADIATELEKIQPGELDVLCLHQSVEGLLPTIGQPEVRLEQLRGKARLVLVGDVHVNKVIDLGEGTTLVSAGSTEMCASDEDPNKVVKLISYDAANHTVVEIRDLPLTTREIVRWVVQTDHEMNLLVGSLRPDLAPRLWLVSYNAEFAHRMPEASRAAAAIGDLFVACPAVQAVEEGSTFVESKESAVQEFEEIVAARHQDPPERQAAVSLWQNPDFIDKILLSLQPCLP